MEISIFRLSVFVFTACLGLFSASMVISAPMVEQGVMDEEGMEEAIGYGYGMGQMMLDDPMWQSPMMHGPVLGGPMMGMRMDPFMGQLHGLDLTTDQRKKIRTIWRELRGAHLKDMEKMMAAQDELFDLMNKDKPDAKKVGEAYINLVETRKKVTGQHTKTRDEILNVLTKEQREKFNRHGFGRHGKGFGMVY